MMPCYYYYEPTDGRGVPLVDADAKCACKRFWSEGAALGYGKAMALRFPHWTVSRVFFWGHPDAQPVC